LSITVYDYYQDADILEVFFTEDSATAVVNLTPDITLHFQPENRTAVSLVFNNFSRLIQPDEYGARTFALQAKGWPDSWRAAMQSILAAPPVNEWITVVTYRPPRAQNTIPLAAVKQPAVLALAT
jgi:uncharacterized protein (DUF1684 family)